LSERRSWLVRLSAWGILVLLAGLAVGWASWSVYEHKLYAQGPLKRFGVIWAHELTRSGMPRDDQGWVWLHEQGVRSIVTFRQENDVDYAKFGFQKVMHIPLSGSLMPTEVQAIAYLKFVEDPADQPVHIHCTAGKDRTGMMAALVRYSIDGWDMKRALVEAADYRGSPLSDRMTEWLRAWEKTHPPGSFKVKP
jgi:hypothetical protein